MKKKETASFFAPQLIILLVKLLNDIFHIIKIPVLDIIIYTAIVVSILISIILHKKYTLEKELLNSILSKSHTISIAQYTLYRSKRSSFNTFKNKMTIIYNIYNNKNYSNYLDVTIIYKFEGINNTGKEISNILLNTKKSYHYFDNPIEVSASYQKKGKKNEQSVNINAKDFPTNKDYKVKPWRLPLVGEPIFDKESFIYNFTLKWERFFSVESPPIIIIDPKNYSTNTKSIDIEVNNFSNSTFSNIKLKEYKVEPFDNQSIPHPEMKPSESEKQKWTHVFEEITENQLFVLTLKDPFI